MEEQKPFRIICGASTPLVKYAQQILALVRGLITETEVIHFVELPAQVHELPATETTVSFMLHIPGCVSGQGTGHYVRLAPVPNEIARVCELACVALYEDMQQIGGQQSWQ